MTTDGPAALRMLAGDFELTKAACWNEGDTASMWTLAAAWDAERAQAAADRAALATAQHANDAERGEWSEYYALLTGDRGAWSPDDMRSAIKAQANALAQAREVMARIESEAREQIAAPDTNAAQMVVSEAVAETCRRIADVLSGAR